MLISRLLGIFIVVFCAKSRVSTGTLAPDTPITDAHIGVPHTINRKLDIITQEY